MSYQNNRFFSKEEAFSMAGSLFTMWPHSNALTWFWQAFRALERHGLTYYENDKEEKAVRERIMILAILYYEYCQQSGFNTSPSFKEWPSELVQELKNDLSEDVQKTITEVHSILKLQWGNIKQLAAEFWVNCYVGDTGLYFTSTERFKLINELLDKGDDNPIDYKKGLNWLENDYNDFPNYKGINS
ncbi:MAG: hypothetical protein N4A72_05620 [Bacteroidales bacterium]|jgi:hypothetical protein|nr:hypothetical protein [Bacteroidales bacterium]